MTDTNKKNEYAKSVALFLAELLRSRKVTLKRAAEIAAKVVANINLVDTEEHFLRLIKELTLDFEELHHLQELISIEIKINKRKQMEKIVIEFAASIMVTDIRLASEVLRHASNDNVDYEQLRSKFPQFNEFMNKVKV
jgi:hypothetical protein